MENYGRALAKLKREGKHKSEEYGAVMERYMRRSCALMCEKYERAARTSLVEMRGIVTMLKVLPDYRRCMVRCFWPVLKNRWQYRKAMQRYLCTLA